MDDELDLAAAALALSLQATTALRRHRLLCREESMNAAEAIEQLIERILTIQPRDEEQRAQLDRLHDLALHLRQDAAR